MKKNFILVMVFTAVILLAVSVSAFWPFDKVLLGPKSVTTDYASWQDSDDGNHPYIGGAVYNGNINTDVCNSDGSVTEYYIEEARSKKILKTFKQICSGGECERVSVSFKGKTLSAGQCKAILPSACVDTDEGDDPKTAGMIELTLSNGNINYNEDTVSGSGSNQKIVEFSCDTDNSAKREEHSCIGLIEREDITIGTITKSAAFCDIKPLTCSKVGNVVTGTDAKGETFTKTDVCLTGTSLKEYTCGPDSALIQATADCPYGCKDGSCRSQSCIDTDGGIKYNQKGTATATLSPTVKFMQEDFCIGSKKLIEFSCASDASTQLSAYVRSCANNCVNGACSGETTTAAS